MNEKIKNNLDSLTPKELDEALKNVTDVSVPAGVSEAKIKGKVRAAAGLEKAEDRVPVKVRKPFAWRKLIPAVAACLVIALAAAIAVPMIANGKSPAVPPSDGTSENGGSENDPSGNVINSLDKVNYYLAESVLGEKRQAAKKSISSGYALTRGAALTFGGVIQRLLSDKPYVAPEPENETGNVDDMGVVHLANGESYYDVDPHQVFTVTKVIRFEIDISNPNCLIAEKVGTGRVTVIITENTLLNMLTFANGDRFYSVSDNEQQGDTMRFFSLKYIDGFRVCKQTNPDVYTMFDVTVTDGTVTGFGCVTNTDGVEINGIELVDGSSEYSDAVSDFTLAELGGAFEESKQ